MILLVRDYELKKTPELERYVIAVLAEREMDDV
jgi:hypothetical protein